MPEPKLTVGLPVYNGEKTLARCLESLVNQTFTDFRIVILDNASTDKTPDIIKEYAARDSRVSFHRHRDNLGQSISSYRLLFSAWTEYYALVHADLQWAPTFAEKCLAALEKDPEAMVAYPQCQFVDAQGNNLELYYDHLDFADPDSGQRFLNVVAGMGWCTAWHGIMRTDKLHERYLVAELLNTGNAAPDNFILAAIAILGKMVQVDEPLLMREKNSYQAAPESKPERYARLFSQFMLFPFCDFIRDHMTLAEQTTVGYGSGALLDKYKGERKAFFEDNAHWAPHLRKLDNVMNKMIGALLASYRPFVEFEIDRMVEKVSAGNIHRTWREDPLESKSPPCKAVGVNRAFDFSTLTRINSGLDFAYSLIPAHPGLHYARALVKMWLGRPDEAMLAVNRELKRDPIHLKAKELQKHLEKVLAEEAAAED